MSSGGEESGKRNGQVLEEIVRGADDYYNYLRKKHATGTRLDAVVVSLVVWFASFVVLGVGALTTIKGSMFTAYLLAAFLAAIVIGIVAGLVTYTVRRRRGFKFAQLGDLIQKMRGGEATSEDGLHLMDAMHQASLVMKKRKMDNAFEYGVVAFAIVTILGLNPGIGALAGVITYLYFRFEALRDSEKEETRYEDSKKALLQSL
jgi:ABC-type multidrug transport system fused ATPase/permease subunit